MQQEYLQYMHKYGMLIYYYDKPTLILSFKLEWNMRQFTRNGSMTKEIKGFIKLAFRPPLGFFWKKKSNHKWKEPFLYLHIINICKDKFEIEMKQHGKDKFTLLDSFPKHVQMIDFEFWREI